MNRSDRSLPNVANTLVTFLDDEQPNLGLAPLAFMFKFSRLEILQF